MKKIIAVFFLCVSAFVLDAREAKWITSSDAVGRKVNQWVRFRTEVIVDNIPEKVEAAICADSKYWLYINGECAVFEGCLKRGPNPTDSYYDSVDLSSFLRKGKNEIEVLVYYFGQSGFSHIDSGTAGLYFDAPAIGLCSGSSWLSGVDTAYGTMQGKKPNYRLPESNISYDARKEGGLVLKESVEVSGKNDGPWGRLHIRPIPQWKDFGVKKVDYVLRQGPRRDTLVAMLPYNAQLTPLISVTAHEGDTIGFRTNHSFAGATENVSSEYVAREGKQVFESLGWMNGEQLRVSVPKGMQVEWLAYRETGYDTEFEGSFVCDDQFVNRFWNKALHTLYVNMRDTFFDCPDRERSQWWGDEVVLSGECFYTLSVSSHKLMRKGMMELVDWATDEAVLHSPIPGNYDRELPGQMLAAIGKYGFWNYYMNTGDLETIRYCYPAVKRYLGIWELDRNGLTAFRKGGWTWGDWGDNKDIRLIYAAMHSLALEGAENMAAALGYEEDAAGFKAIRAKIKDAYNMCWDGEAYRHPDYKDLTDDRVQALAVLAGIAPEEYYDKIFEFIKKTEHASPYMEKYVEEALFCMGHGDYAMERMRKRFAPMVNDNFHTTLYEGWGIGKLGVGGGTTNHAWSGGPLTVIAGKLCGIKPEEAGYGVFSVKPVGGIFKSYSIVVPTVRGQIVSTWNEKENGKIIWELKVPFSCTAKVTIPWNGREKTLKSGTYRFRN